MTTQQMIELAQSELDKAAEDRQAWEKVYFVERAQVWATLAVASATRDNNIDRHLDNIAFHMGER